MWWQRQSKPDPNAALVQVLKEEITVLRLQHDTDLQRMDRLMEALARRANVDLVMPISPAPIVPHVPMPNPWKDHNPVTGNFQLKQKEKTQ